MRWMVLMFMLVCVSPLSAQSDDSTRFAAPDGQLAFTLPAGWTVETYSPDEYSVLGDDIELFIQLGWLNDLDPLPTNLLAIYFANRGYSSPVPITLREDREGAMIQDNYESIIAFLLNDERFALVFVTADPNTRAAYAETVTQLAASMQYGEPPAETPESTAEAPIEERAVISRADFVEGSFSVLDGTLTLHHPESWFVESFEDEIVVYDDAGRFYMGVFADPSFFFEMYGIDGNPNEVTTPDDILALFAPPDDDSFTRLQYTVGGNRVARLDYSDESTDFALLVVQVAPRRLVSIIMDAEAGTLMEINSTLDAMIASMRYREGQ